MYKIIKILAVLVLAGGSVNGQTITETFGTGANQFSIDFVTIGNPGNAADTTGNPNPAGSVTYTYNIGKFEISRDMILKANAMAGFEITMRDMAASGGNRTDSPALGISWNEAARFVNYLNASKGYQEAYKFVTGGINDPINLWSFEDSAQNGTNRFRHKDAIYFLPSADEWYKAAYASPSGTWYDYPTGSDSAPSATSGGLLAGTAVYGSFIGGPADITNAGGLSPYGTMAQGGNAWELVESARDGSNDSATENRGHRGGEYGLMSSMHMNVIDYGSTDPSSEGNATGFRVAMVPEPSALWLLAVGLSGLAMMRRRLQ